jgi:hypothetical protein
MGRRRGGRPLHSAGWQWRPGPAPQLASSGSRCAHQHKGRGLLCGALLGAGPGASLGACLQPQHLRRGGGVAQQHGAHRALHRHALHLHRLLGRQLLGGRLHARQQLVRLRQRQARRLSISAPRCSSRAPHSSGPGSRAAAGRCAPSGRAPAAGWRSPVPRRPAPPPAPPKPIPSPPLAGPCTARSAGGAGGVCVCQRVCGWVGVCRHRHRASTGRHGQGPRCRGAGGGPGERPDCKTQQQAPGPARRRLSESARRAPPRPT